MTTNIREALLDALDASALPLYHQYVSRLQSDEATIDDLRKGVDQIMRAKGIGVADKADTRVSVDIVFENGLVTTASPPRVEYVEATRDALDAVVKGAGTLETVPPMEASEALPAPPVHQDADFDALMADIHPIEPA